MSARHRLRCGCGHVEGHVDLTATVNRGTCYCKDCQAFAYFLGHAEQILDERGGSDIVQTSPQAVQFTKGMEYLACIRLTPNGLMRWYARCCNTPIGNTLSNYRMSFVGLVHACLADPTHSLDESFGATRMRGYTQSAMGDPKPDAYGLLQAMVRLGGMMLKARLTGAYRRTPFFSRDGAPVVAPKILSPDELRAVMTAVSRHGEAV